MYIFLGRGEALYFIMGPFKKLTPGPLACQTDIAFKIITQNWNYWTLDVHFGIL